MKQTLILSLVITLLSGIYGYHLYAQESINPLVLCAETVTRGAKELSVDISALAQGNYLLTYYDGDTLIATQELHKL